MSLLPGMAKPNDHIIDPSEFSFYHNGEMWMKFVQAHYIGFERNGLVEFVFAVSKDPLNYPLTSPELFNLILNRTHKTLSKAQELELILIDRSLPALVKSYLEA